MQNTSNFLDLISEYISKLPKQESVDVKEQVDQCINSGTDLKIIWELIQGVHETEKLNYSNEQNYSIQQLTTQEVSFPLC